MNKNKKQTIIIFPIIIVVIISILVSIVFVFNNTNTIDYESKLEEAQKYVDEMDYKKAEIAYLEAIEIDSKQAKAYIELADIYELNNQNEKVAEVLNKAKKTVSSNYKKEITKKINKIGAKKVYIINIVEREEYSRYTQVDERIIEIPALLDTNGNIIRGSLDLLKGEVYNDKNK